MTSILQPHLTPPRPREKLLSRGAQSLEDVELIALLLGTGQPGKPVMTLAQELLDEFGSISATLSAPWEQLRLRPGIGYARFSLFQAARELAKRASAEPLSERPLMNAPEKVSQLLLARSLPSETAERSQAAQLLTTQLPRTLAGPEIVLLDHLIAAGSRTISASEV